MANETSKVQNRRARWFRAAHSDRYRGAMVLMKTWQECRAEELRDGDIIQTSGGLIKEIRAVLAGDGITLDLKEGRPEKMTFGQLVEVFR